MSSLDSKPGTYI